MLKPWHYDVLDYEKCISSVMISPKRMNKLKTVDDLSITPLIERIKKTRKCGYQENIIKDLIMDIKSLC
ncbi:hypothetical protein [Desulfoscipio gibsoniae]|uniref:hypothetical protein n=1 Tax=Desulfoscipio gibsoniae TaxID=102134 RepID=UPI000232B008